METRIELREHQVPMAEKLDNLYTSGKNFAGVVLATGGGKSFIAMDQIIKFANQYNERNNVTEEDLQNSTLLSEVAGYYAVPTNIIAYQVQLHIAEHLIGPENLIRYEREHGNLQSGNEIQTTREILSKINPRIQIDDQTFDGMLEEVRDSISPNDPNPTRTTVDLLLKKSFEQAKANQIEKVVKDAFPNLNFTTYQAIEKKSIKEISKMKADFIIFDEAHRAGAEKWWPKVKALIEKSKAKVLAITATPERDADERDMMRDLAGLKVSGYSVRDLRKKEYLAGNMPLLKAIEGNHILPPDVVHFNCKLEDTQEFEDAVMAYIRSNMKVYSLRSGTQSYNNAQSAYANIKSALEQMLVEIRKNPLIDYDDSLTPQEKEARKQEDEQKLREEIIGTQKYGREENTLMSRLGDIIRDGIKRKLKEDEIYASCIAQIKDEKWEALKEERISAIIEGETSRRGLSHCKAINFIEPMDKGPKDETKEEKVIRAKNHIKEKIDEIKKFFTSGKIPMPLVTAIHSTAFTDAENKDTLNEFIRQSSKKGPMKIIMAVSKFNEGFHPDGIRALFMTKPIKQNAKKSSEPRIILLQQIGRSLSSGQKEKSVIFDVACNFMRNREKFKAESEKECFSFLRLSEAETKFLECAKRIQSNSRKKPEKAPDADKLFKILEILNNCGLKINSNTIPENITLRGFIESISDEKLREDVLDKLYDIRDGDELNPIDLDEDGDFDLGNTYRLVRKVYLGKEENRTILTKVENIPLSEMLKMGIIEAETPEGIKSLEGNINKAGFIVRGVVEGTFAYNVYTGTLYDGPESDEDRKDYYGCRPDGRDPAGYDKNGFDKDGIHRATGKKYDERHFTPVKTENESGEEVVKWYYEDPETGAKSETDPLGFNHDGINPETGFDRQGYWHRKNEDGTFTLKRTRLNPEKRDVHDFVFYSVSEKLGTYLGKKGLFRNPQHLYSNGSLEQSGIYKESDRYGTDGYDIDGYDVHGFNKNGIHRDTSTKYGLDGIDKQGRMQPDLTIAKTILEIVPHSNWTPEQIIKKLGRTPEEIDRILENAFSMSRTFRAIAQSKGKDIDPIGLIETTRKSPKAVDTLFELSPSMREQQIRIVRDNRTMNEYYQSRVEQITTKMQTETIKHGEIKELEEYKVKIDSKKEAPKFREQDEDDFIV